MPRYVRVHQSRTHEPTTYETEFATALEKVYGEVGHELADVVRGLNELGVRPPGGDAWTEDSFRAEIKRLGA